MHQMPGVPNGAWPLASALKAKSAAPHTRHVSTNLAAPCCFPPLADIKLACRSPDFGKGRSKRKAAKSADILLVVAEHRLPKGVTSLCPSTAPGMPVTAGTRNGDIFQLTMIRQVWLLSLTHPPQLPTVRLVCSGQAQASNTGFAGMCLRRSGTQPESAASRAAIVCQRLLQRRDVLQGTFVQERVYSAPCGQVHDLAMPHQCSDLVASCSHEEIRLWDTRRHLELLRIGLPSIDCLCLTIPKVLVLASCTAHCLRNFDAV